MFELENLKKHSVWQEIESQESIGELPRLKNYIEILFSEIEERDLEIKRLKKLAKEDDDPFSIWLRSM